jgi:hypothetical protein
MPRWSKAVLRTVGALDIALSLCGLYLLYASVWGGVFALKASADAPYFKIAFEAMTATNGVVLTLFLLAGFQLLWRDGAHYYIGRAHCVRRINRNILGHGRTRRNEHRGRDGRREYGNCSFSRFQPCAYVYPIASTVLLFLARRKAPTLRSSQGIAQ